jgi:hypothetical protein
MVERLPATLLLLGLLCARPLPAQAGSVLVLGFVEDGKPNQRLRQAVMTFLQRMGEEVVGSNLSVADQQCMQTDCLVRLGSQYQAQRVIGGELFPNDNSYRIMVWLYDRVSDQPNSAEARCTDCNPDLLSETVARTAGQVLEASTPTPAAAAPITEAPPPPLPAASPPRSQRCPPAARTFGRGVAIGSLAALSAAGLVTTIGLAGTSGSLYRAQDGSAVLADIHYRLAPAAGLAGGLTALVALGLTAAALPWDRLRGQPGPSESSCPPTPSRLRFGRGLASGALGSLGLAGLVSGIALTSVNGSVYGRNLDGSSISYALKPHSFAAYGLAAGLLAGLGLTLLWP